ncbi:hypothetical protein PCE1_001573 [Barthelona sp. PCE]
MHRFILVTLALLAVAVCSAPYLNQKVLCVTEDEFTLKEYLAEFDKYDITVSLPEDVSDLYSYSHVLLLANDADSFGSYSVEDFVKFFDKGGNLMIAGGEETSDFIFDLANELGVQMSTSIISSPNYFAGNFDDDDMPEKTWVVAQPEDVFAFPVGLTDTVQLPFLHYGSGFFVEDNRINLVIPPEGSIDVEEEDEVDSLMVAFQGRNSARLVLIGSQKVLTDNIYNAEVRETATDMNKMRPWAGNSNKYYTVQITKWLLHEVGVVQMNGKPVYDERVYIVGEEMDYTVNMRTWNDAKNEWEPICLSDMQLSIRMVDPFIRKTMTCKGGAHNLVTKLPDRYGVFTMEVDYEHVGLTNVRHTDEVVIRSLPHTHFMRFIKVAYPYYAVVIACMIAVICVFCLTLGHLQTEKKKKVE